MTTKHSTHVDEYTVLECEIYRDMVRTHLTKVGRIMRKIQNDEFPGVTDLSRAFKDLDKARSQLAEILKRLNADAAKDEASETHTTDYDQLRSELNRAFDRIRATLGSDRTAE